MSDTSHELWFFIDGKRSVSAILVSPNETIHNVKMKIYKAADLTFTRLECNARDPILTKVRYYITVSINTDTTMASAGLLHL